MKDPIAEFARAADALPCRVSVVIKALNEERHIAAAIETSLEALARVGGEVILADACSTDNTVAVASRYPVRIVQLDRAEHRSCGAGPQLGYQHSRGEFIYIMDGDMRLVPDFLQRALAFLEAHPEVAGTGGQVVEQNMHIMEFRDRAERAAAKRVLGRVDRLDGGGLYRRSAIDQVGYLSDRHLHSYEEFDLGARLRTRGWQLWRLADDAVLHYGHEEEPYRLLWRRWRSGYICGLGELLRAAAGQPHLPMVIREIRELRLYAAVVLWWVLLLVTVLMPLPVGTRLGAFAALALAPFLAMVLRKRSLSRGVHAVVSWCFNAAGLLRGMLRPEPASRAIESRVLRDPLHRSLQSLEEQSCA